MRTSASDDDSVRESDRSPAPYSELAPVLLTRAGPTRSVNSYPRLHLLWAIMLRCGPVAGTQILVSLDVTQLGRTAVALCFSRTVFRISCRLSGCQALLYGIALYPSREFRTVAPRDTLPKSRLPQFHSVLARNLITHQRRCFGHSRIRFRACSPTFIDRRVTGPSQSFRCSLPLFRELLIPRSKLIVNPTRNTFCVILRHDHEAPILTSPDTAGNSTASYPVAVLSSIRRPLRSAYAG